MSESIILQVGSLRVLTPAYPDECSYVRIAEFDSTGNEIEEHVIWNSDEIREDPSDTLGAALGAALGAIKSIIDGNYRRV